MVAVVTMKMAAMSLSWGAIVVKSVVNWLKICNST